MTEAQWRPFSFQVPDPIEFTFDAGLVEPAPRNPSSLVDDSPGVVLRARPEQETPA